MKKVINYTIIGLIAYVILLTFVVVQKTETINQQKQEIKLLQEQVSEQDSMLVNLDAAKDSTSSHIPNK